MANKKIKVERGQTVNLALPVERGRQRQTERGSSNRALQPSDPDPDSVYAFPKKGLSIFDLGTRKVGPDFQHVAFASFPLPDSPLIPLLDEYNAAMIAGDVPHNQKICAQLPQQSEFLFVDVVFKKDSEVKRCVIGNKDKRPFVKDLADTGASNVAESKWKKGTLAFKESGEWDLRIESAWFYNEFDTSDTVNFKVTATSDPASATVPFKATSKAFSIYLTPRCNYTFNLAGDTVLISRYLPVLPFSSVTDSPIREISETTFDGVLLETHATSAFWNAALSNYYSSVFASAWDSTLSWIDDLAGAFLLVSGLGSPALVALILKGGETFYVWRTGTDDNVEWQTVRLFNPDF